MQQSSPKAAKSESTKTHRRSRTGCFTCRLRRKKCDEGKPKCKACHNLGLTCEYKRPVWWASADLRKRHKEGIKMMIKRTKLSEKVQQIPALASADSPPELTRSGASSDAHSDSLRGRRSLSCDSGYSLQEEYDHMDGGDYDKLSLNTNFHYVHPALMDPAPFHPFAPFDGSLSDKQVYINTMPIRRPSIAPPKKADILNTASMTPPAEPFIMDSQMPQPFFDDSLSFLTGDYSYPTPPETQVQYVPVDEADQPLLDHFISVVLPLLFPLLPLHTRQDVLLPALSTNKSFMHCCLSIAAMHLKSTLPLPHEQIDADIMRHRYATILTLSESLSLDSSHLQALEATLGLILFPTSVGTSTDPLPDIAWHQHFQAAISLITRLGLPPLLTDHNPTCYMPAPFSMTLSAWIDILGATMLGRAPEFADTYRDQHLSSAASGLQDLMGCDDRVMYLISEIACLEALKADNVLSPIEICNHVTSLGQKLDETELSPSVFSRPENQLITDAFRYAARIYLCSLVPGFDKHADAVKQLLDRLVACLEAIPSGPDGLDKSLVWVLLVGGSVATNGSAFRAHFEKRRVALGVDSELGSYGRMVRVVEETWAVQDAGNDVHWRDVMRGNGWDWLLI
ncbi:hypothetical protein BJ508DRAFT_242137 [Ascobolus immersus RN42]|uniref:Zn(2)-C6 fungal-type domain-containing protein n=1 Tax=Ascobolus immersus RN42 TaxID=1160509 RepID=A0A3N4HZD5_ASCIM|nr:hypothetical protein BJ508DRAFT_242137 [Ascobolus immersus RN42]